jgi:hypothetical protein
MFDRYIKGIVADDGQELLEMGRRLDGHDGSRQLLVAVGIRAVGGPI